MNGPSDPVGAIADVTVASEVIIAGRDQVVANAAVYSNIGDLNPVFGQHLFGDIYIDRTARLAPIVLSRLDADCTLCGGDEFLVRSRGRLLVEQIAPYIRDDKARVHDLAAAWRPVDVVREECLLAARFGLYTWGHWLGELLPKIVVAEACFPGRFRYVLPIYLATDPDPRLPTERMRESLLAYGIGRERLLLVSPTMNYRFDRLHMVGPIWSDHLMHPVAADLMRSAIRLPPQPIGRPAGGARIGLIRLGPGRMIRNLAELRSLLEAQCFEFATVGALPFTEQVRLFQGASMIFATLGSDLTGLVYAPEGVRVLTAAPAVFGDRFFYALILNRGGRYADVRGQLTDIDDKDPHRSGFRVEPEEIEAALAALADRRC